MLLSRPYSCSGYTYTHAPFLLISELREGVKHLNCLQFCQVFNTRASGQHPSPSFPTHLAELLGSNLSGGRHPHLNRPELSYSCLTCV